MVGATPVFVDIDPETYALDVAAAARAITPAHARDHARSSLRSPGADGPIVVELARAHRLAVVEDARAGGWRRPGRAPDRRLG